MNRDIPFEQPSNIPFGDSELPMETVSGDGIMCFDGSDMFVTEEDLVPKVHHVTPEQIMKSQHTAVNVTRKEFIALIQKITKIDVRVHQNFQMLKSIENLLKMNFVVASDKQGFAQKYKIDIPFKTVDEVSEFEQILLTNEECRKDTKMLIQILIDDEENVSKNVTAILKKFLKREVAMNYTVTRKTEGKIVFKSAVPQFCACIIDVSTSVLKVTEAKIFSALSTAFTNSKDWDGHRPNRLDKKSKNDDTAAKENNN